jgi:hypothetical protein
VISTVKEELYHRGHGDHGGKHRGKPPAHSPLEAEERVTPVLPEPARSYLSGKWDVLYCLQTLLPRFARDAVVLSWISLISAFPARRIVGANLKIKCERLADSGRVSEGVWHQVCRAAPPERNKIE